MPSLTTNISLLAFFFILFYVIPTLRPEFLAKQAPTTIADLVLRDMLIHYLDQIHIVDVYISLWLLFALRLAVVISAKRFASWTRIERAETWEDEGVPAPTGNN